MAQNNKEFSKQTEYAKKQQQLRDLGTSLNHGNSKVLSADSMIEDLLSKKETFQKRNPEVSQTMQVPGWLCGGVPVPLYERVWAGVQSAGGLADTPRLSSLLISSGLSTDTLGYIWSLANHTVPGALTQQELYSVLAMVALAQTGYVVNNISALYQLPQAPLPSLDLSLLPTRTPTTQVYPSPLNVACLPESSNFTWTPSDTAHSVPTDKIGVSYVSTGPMVSPNLLAEQTTSPSTFNGLDYNSASRCQETFSNNLSSKMSSNFKSGDHKHCGSTLQFSFPKLNDSPSHVIPAKPDDPDPFDDEFSDFQSANFTSTSSSTDNHSIPVISNKEEFSGFQKAPSQETDDLSVLVIGGKNTTSAQQLWVTDTFSVGQESHTDMKENPAEKSNNLLESNFSESSMKDNIKSSKYDVFHDIDDDKYSIFHNPLPDEEDTLSNASGNAAEFHQPAPKSIFNHSLFNDPDATLYLFASNNTPSLDLGKVDSDKQVSNAISSNINNENEDDDEFTNFQTFSAPFAEKAEDVTFDEKVDTYDVFRTDAFENTTSLQFDDAFSKPEIDVKRDGDLYNFDTDLEISNQGDWNKSSNNLFDDKKQSSEITFGDFQESLVLPLTNNPKIDDLFSSLSVSEKESDKDIKQNVKSVVSHVEDKYKALRLLEPETVEGDDFGEFFGAEIPVSGGDVTEHSSKKSVQIRVLEECLNILREGAENMSKLNGLPPEDVPGVFKEPRVKFYLDCLMEIHRVCEYIICNLEGDTSAYTLELKRIWEVLSPYYVHSEHNLLPETNGAVCGICRSSTGPSPITFGAQTFHAPCANLYLHCVEPVLPNITSTTVQ